MLQTIWQYRYFILSSIKTEFRSRFARSKLGGFWMILHPLAQVAIYAVVLSAVLSAKLPGIDNRFAYALYLMSGMLGWNLFAEVLNRSVNIFVENGNLIQKLSFPKITLPLVVMGSALVNNVLLFAAMLVVFGLLGHFPNLAILWLPLMIFMTLGIAAGLGLFLAILNVFIRDIFQVMTIVLQFWFWLTPVVYMHEIIPESYRHLLFLNPIAVLVVGFQDILLYRQTPDLVSLVYPLSLAIILPAIAYVMYKRGSEDMADAL
ncbi:MAG TPA: ABC transporter permease [Desulfuromonadales bacterium]|nr:ABC transporter permease [Desulfuromonadales bacterium]